jgi:hypothetical protein
VVEAIRPDREHQREREGNPGKNTKDLSPSLFASLRKLGLCLGALFSGELVREKYGQYKAAIRHEIGIAAGTRRAF